MTVYEKSAMQRLAETSEDMELWWDSSPLIFKTWSKEMLGKVSGKEKDLMAKWLEVLFNEEKPEDTLFSGVTTNPRLTRKVLDLIPDEVNSIVDKIINDNPSMSNYELAWEVYREITKEGTKLYMPLFEKSNYRKGYVSAQVDPRIVTDVRN
jgi:transaldolase